MEDSSLEIISKLENGVFTITLNRPDKRNSLTTEMIEELIQLFSRAQKEDEIKVLIITGNGPGFCTGPDVEKRFLPRIINDVYVPLEKSRSERLDPFMLSFAASLYEIGKPTIAAVNGIAAGAGLSIALLCDFRIVSEHAKFVCSWLNVGLVPDVGATFVLPRLIGADKALKLFFTKEPIGAAHAAQIGLVTEVVPHGDLMAASRKLADTIASGPSVGIELTKRAVYRGLIGDMSEQLQFENYAQGICFATGDFQEGIRAFREKRKPNFQGR